MTIRGLPAHPLLVHAVVIGLPLVALAVVLAAVWPSARRRLGVVTPVAALVVVALVPLTVSAGRDLVRTVGGTPAIAAHARAGSTLLPWAIGLFVVALAVWMVGRRADAGTRPLVDAGPGAAATMVRGEARTATAVQVLTVVVAIVAIAVAVLATWQVVEIGESGARAVWGGIGT